ncbi:SusC/RagA family TonB-linked outer membrane protein [Spirosoma validum]|uniref:SusC/RagA family TonB-linked outer membrane protein n=1 Tax=Spirosoma validum TaxID=2771355 RepID=A0A927GGE8_9BACT|nr:SusC/RagA family TonB-linked outer membrane protein [Spirosoma validum]MBD2756804.1 SusC/RagA family TonB-linked outer membrane protein [Spirosoma validum]
MNNTFTRLQTRYCQSARWLFGLGLALLTVATFAQTAGTVSGTVADPESGQGLPGVNVVSKGSSRGTTTDGNGRYQLTGITPATILVFSSVGYTSQEITVGNQTTIDVKLSSDNKSLNEVVVLGYTTTTQKNLTGAAQAVSAKELKDVTSNNVGQLLQGKAAGVFVGNSSGDPRTPPKVLIRGIGTLTANSDPLYVVDGVIGGIPNPSDIESITVLKDAASTALYGARASNGVIVVTTRRGTSGKAQITARLNKGVGYLSLGNFRLMNGQELYDLQKAVFQRDRPTSNVNDYLPAPEANANINWFDQAFRPATNTLAELSAAGGSDKTRFFLSGNYYQEDGILKGTGLNRFGLRLNFSHNLSEKFRVSLNSAGTYTRGYDDSNGSLYGAYTYLPYDDPYYNGVPYNPITGAKKWYGRDNANFIYNQQFNTFKENTLAGDVLLKAEYDLLPWLSLSTTNRAQTSFYGTETSQDLRGNAAADVQGRLTNYNSRVYSLLTSNLLRFRRSFEGGHSLDGLAGYEYQTNAFSSLGATGKGIFSGLTILDATSQPESINGTKMDNAFSSYLFQANYGYKEKYLVTTSFRRDGSSKFGRDRKYGNFYAVGVTWIASNEAFLNNNSTLNNLKFRLSYGTTGSASGTNGYGPTGLTDGINDYAAQGLYSLTGQYAGTPSATPTRIENPNLSWEVSNNANFGVDVTLWNRLNVTVDLYNRLTNNLLFNRPLQGTSGYSFITENIGAVRNQGIEIVLSADILQKTALKWRIEANLGMNRNRLTALYGDRTFVANGMRPFALDQPLNSWYMRRWAGVDAPTGDPLWEKINTDGTVTTTNNYNEAALQFIGSNANPKAFGGIRQVLNWKGFELNAFFTYATGVTLYNGDRNLFDNDGAYDRYNLLALQDGWSRWEKPGDVATHPKYVIGGNKNAQRPSSRFLENGNYLRLRNVSLSYDLPKAVVSKARLGSVRLTASADNLFTVTKFSGIDPDVTETGEVGTKYPFSKKFVFGVQLGF